MRPLFLLAAVMFFAAGCASVEQRALVAGYYTARINKPNPESLSLWIAKDGSFRLLYVPERSDLVDGDLLVPGVEDGHWRIFFGALKMRTDVRSWAPHLPKITSFAQFDGRALRWRGVDFMRDAEKERPNQAPEPTTTLVTPRADARVAPSAVVAHL